MRRRTDTEKDIHMKTEEEIRVYASRKQGMHGAIRHWKKGKNIS